MALVLYIIGWSAPWAIFAPGVYCYRRKSGNIDVLVQTSGLLNSSTLDLLLTVFSNFARRQLVPGRHARPV